MNDFISREALKKTFKALVKGEIKDLLRIVDTEPKADVEPVRHAHWIEHKWAEEVDNFLIPNFECSACHMWKREDSSYCPDCGAKMDERRTENEN